MNVNESSASCGVSYRGSVVMTDCVRSVVVCNVFCMRECHPAVRKQVHIT